MAESNSTLEDNPLYNSPTFSDITVRQTINSKSRDYKLHKVILASQSVWFRNALAGNFKEATAQVLELHDDNPRYLEMLLKMMYSRNYEPGREGSTSFQSCEDIIGIYIVADKYGCDDIETALPEKLQSYIERTPWTLQQDLIAQFYGECGKTAGTDMGKVFANQLVYLGGCLSLEQVVECRDLFIDYPDFARDILLHSIDQYLAYS